MSFTYIPEKSFLGSVYSSDENVVLNKRFLLAVSFNWKDLSTFVSAVLSTDDIAMKAVDGKISFKQGAILEEELSLLNAEVDFAYMLRRIFSEDLHNQKHFHEWELTISKPSYIPAGEICKKQNVLESLGIV